jgi:NAD(P)-dependent dehydrogenase (short-subunit alcohol dehydrogenase family)
MSVHRCELPQDFVRGIVLIYVITGAASGIGAATAARLRGSGHDVIGVDLAGAEIDADLSTSVGRAQALEQITARTEVVDGVVPCAGLAGVPGRSGGLLTALNYFGAIELITGLRGHLRRSTQGAVVAIASNSVSTSPGVSDSLVEACLAGDELAAIEIGDEVGGLGAYPSTKTAICRWVRRNAVLPEWTGAGITVNAVAPGATETAMVAEIREDPVIGQFFDQFPIPVGRPGDPDEIAAVIAFLLGPDARFFCGSIIYVDGGTDALLRADDWPTPL